MSTTQNLDPIARLNRDIKRASVTLGRDEARFLVDTYYSIQDFRIQSDNQIRSIVKGGTEEPHATLQFFADQFGTMERQIQSALDTYSASQPMGEWARRHVGVGPVISAGLLAHIDITRAPHAASIWRFAGLLPDQKKKKGVKRDWNADLKVLCWKLSDSFVKLKNHESCYYGHLYAQRKQLEVIRNDNGVNRATAAATLGARNIKDAETRATYESGRLPDGRLDLRARRYAVKRFLSHYFEQAWWFEYGTEPPNPYVQEYLGHEHIEPPPVPFIKAKASFGKVEA